MVTTVTSRHFKAHETLVEYAENAMERLSHYYDGILRCDFILSYEKARNSVKSAEIVVTVYRSKLRGIEHSDDYQKSIDGAVAKVKAQLKKYKDKLRAKDRKVVREVREKV
ncbi:MAG: ribosome-associated translation inhibitor RaiA [bacterium]